MAKTTAKAKKPTPQPASAVAADGFTESIVETAGRLAEILRDDPESIEADLLAQGQNLVGVYVDANFSGRNFSDLLPLKITTLKQAIDDIAGGVLVLRSSTLGVTFRTNKLMTFVSPLSSTPQGTVVYSIAWKDSAAFLRWREDASESELPQDQLNAAIYFLTHEWSKLLL